jgi:hypothetical protein
MSEASRAKWAFYLAGLFCTLTPRAYALDVSYFGAVKSARYEQATNSAPAVLATNAYAFTAFAISTNGMLNSANVKPPNATPARSMTSDTNRMNWQYEELFNTQAALDAAYPGPTSAFLTDVYTFKLYTVNDGTQTASPYYWGLLGDIPTTPQITNLLAAQTVDTTCDFTLRWSPFGGSSDIAQLSVLDAVSNVVFASPLPFTTGALSGASSACTIPPKTLPWGTNLTGHLTFGKPHVPDNTSYPGALGIVALARDTAFPIVTRPAPVRPVLSPRMLTNGACQLTFTGESNRFYHLQATTNWSNGSNWLDLFVTNLPGAQGSFTDTGAASLNHRYYRIQIGP